MKEFKGTKGKWNASIVHGVCIGVECDLGSGYSQMIVNTILPDTDKQYAKEKLEILSNVAIIAAAPDLLEALQSAIAFVKHNVPQPPIVKAQVDKWQRTVDKALSTTDYN